MVRQLMKELDELIEIAEELDELLGTKTESRLLSLVYDIKFDTEQVIEELTK